MNPTESYNRVLKELMVAVETWVAKTGETESAEVERNSAKVAQLILRELLTNFGSATVKKLEERVKAELRVATSAASRETNAEESTRTQFSLDYPVALREIIQSTEKNE